MRSWVFLLSGLLIWAVHFFLLYGIGEFGGTGGQARVAIGSITILALAAIGFAIRAAFRGAAVDSLDGWMRRLAFGGLAIAALAIIWQGLPVLLA